MDVLEVPKKLKLKQAGSKRMRLADTPCLSTTFRVSRETKGCDDGIG